MKCEFEKKLKTYMNDFVNEEDGMELLQTAIVVALAAGLIIVVAYLFTQVGKKIGDAGDQVDALDVNTPVNSNPYSSSGGTNAPES